MGNRQITVSKKDGILINHLRLLSQRKLRKQPSYQQVIHIKLWITFLFIFSKITCILYLYVLQYKHNKERINGE